MQKDQQKLAELIQGKKVAFIGAGVSHKTLIKEFVELGAHVTLCDQKKSVEEFGDYAATIRELGIDLSLGEHYLDGFKGQDIIMRTPGFVGYFEKPLQDAMAAGTMVTSEVELFFDFCPCEIVAVTGSDGKTTTTTLISKFYEAAGRKVHLGGNIGAALLPMLPEVRPEDVAVVELSSFQLISMHQSPKIAVVTNVTPNHLDHHKDMQEYIDAKRNILLYQNPPCRAVLGYENEISRSMQKDCKGRLVHPPARYRQRCIPAQRGQHALHGRGRRGNALPGPEGHQAAGPAQYRESAGRCRRSLGRGARGGHPEGGQHLYRRGAPH